MNIKDITVNYRTNPIGLDELPRFSWKLSGSEAYLMQTAYRIVVSACDKIIWDSGRVDSSQSLFIPYKGESLKSFTKYMLRIKVWDNYGHADELDSSFETGIINTSQWAANWITHTFEEGKLDCPIFWRRFNLSGQKVKCARIYSTALGVYDIFLNGQRVGDSYFAPGWTSYHNRLQYQTYDVTELLQKKNKIEIIVGNGWYKGYLNCDRQNCFYGDRTAICAEIRIEYEDACTECILTDDSWTVATGYIRSSELYLGECQDFTVQDLNEYQSVLLRKDACPKKIVAQESEPIRITEELDAKSLFRTPKGELVIDFGQNMAGFVRIKLPRIKGTSLKIHHAETLDKDGNFYTDNLRSAKSVDEYIYNDADVGRIVTPHFTYHGFRYISIDGVDENIDKNIFVACALHTDMKKTGHFEFSDKKIGRLQSNIEWGQRSNFFDIPTDCPQRDERLGWTGDAQIFSATAMYNYNCALFYKKWLRDVAVESDDEHGVPHIVPNIIGPSTGTAIWSDCATIIPWNLYMAYGDVSVLEEQYSNMKQWIEYIRRATGPDILWMNGFQRGDWLSLDSDESLHLMSGGTDKNLVANIYYAYSVRIVRESARILGIVQDFEMYSALYDQIVEALNNEYVTPNGRLVSETQTACVLLLHFNLLKPMYKDRVIRILIDNLEAHGGNLTTGFAGTAYICHALSENGLHKQAGELLFSEDYPGWLYEINMGATTIWERWNSIRPDGTFDTSGMNSLNHYSYGAVGDWLYSKVAGINCLEPGYRKILIRPMLTKGLISVDASYESMYGTILCKYSCFDGLISIDIKIPPNTTADVYLPEKSSGFTVGSGVYHYEYTTATSLAKEKFAMNSKIGELFSVKDAKNIFEKHLPEMLASPMLNYIKNITLNELVRMSPSQKSKIIALLADFNT